MSLTLLIDKPLQYSTIFDVILLPHFREAEEIEVIKAAEEAALREAETANQEAVAVAIAHGIITQVWQKSSQCF